MLTQNKKPRLVLEYFWSIDQKYSKTSLGFSFFIVYYSVKYSKTIFFHRSACASITLVCDTMPQTSMYRIFAE
jgi:hypothetical protein